MQLHASKASNSSSAPVEVSCVRVATVKTCVSPTLGTLDARRLANAGPGRPSVGGRRTISSPPSASMPCSPQPSRGRSRKVTAKGVNGCTSKSRQSRCVTSSSREHPAVRAYTARVAATQFRRPPNANKCVCLPTMASNRLFNRTCLRQAG